MTVIDEVREYVEQMSPVFRIALLQTPLIMAKNEGWDDAMRKAQQDLLAILGKNDRSGAGSAGADDMDPH